MALQIRFLVRKLSSLIRTKTIWQSVARSDPVNMYKYNLSLNELTNNKDEVKEYLNFQSKMFKSCPTDLLNNLISKSFEIVKEKKLVYDVDVYNLMLKNYVINNINFDVKNLTQEMRDKKIEFNKETFSLLIKYYCNIGDMDNVEILVKKMKSSNAEVDLYNKIEIIKGYIIAGHPEKSKNYIIENGFKENNPEIATALLLGYSSVGKIDIVMEMIDKMKQNNVNLSANKYFQFYVRLAQSNTPDSNLEKILLAMPDPKIDEIINIILDLNRVELFDYSLKLLKKYKDQFAQQLIRTDLRRSYNTKNCPTEIYKQALTILLQFNYTIACSNLFAYMDYNDATIFANNLINDNNSKHIAASLVNKAINEKEIDKIEISLQFAKDKLDLRSFNMLLIFNYIPSMLENGLVSNCQELINLFPAFKINVIPASFIYCLMKKDFDQFSDLRTIYKLKTVFVSQISSIAKEIVNNYESIDDLNRLAIQVGTVFEPIFVNYLLSDIVVHKIINSSRNENVDGIQDAIKLAENFDVSFATSQLNNLVGKANQHEKIFKCLFNRISPIKLKEQEIIFAK